MMPAFSAAIASIVVPSWTIRGAQIAGVYVRPEYRGQGITSAAIAAIANTAIANTTAP